MKEDNMKHVDPVDLHTAEEMLRQAIVAEAKQLISEPDPGPEPVVWDEQKLTYTKAEYAAMQEAERNSPSELRKKRVQELADAIKELRR